MKSVKTEQVAIVGTTLQIEGRLVVIKCNLDMFKDLERRIDREQMTLPVNTLHVILTNESAKYLNKEIEPEDRGTRYAVFGNYHIDSLINLWFNVCLKNKRIVFYVLQNDYDTKKIVHDWQQRFPGNIFMYGIANLFVSLGERIDSEFSAMHKLYFKNIQIGTESSSRSYSTNTDYIDYYNSVSSKEEKKKKEKYIQHRIEVYKEQVRGILFKNKNITEPTSYYDIPILLSKN